MKDKKRLLIISLCILLFIVIAILLFNDNISTFDNLFYKKLISLKSDFVTNYFKIITRFADPITIIILCSISLLTLYSKKKYSLYLIGTVVITTIFNQVLKHLITRPRPIEINIITESGYSFPSGHTMNSVAFYGFIVYLVMKSKLKKRNKWIINSLLTFLIINICLSRVYLGVHYASDIIAGFLLSVIILVIITFYIKKYKGEII